MFDRIFGKKKNEDSMSYLLGQTRIAIVNQNYKFSDDLFIRELANGLSALLVVDSKKQVRSLSRSEVQMNESELFDLALNNTAKAGIKDENDIITISNGTRSIEVIKFETKDYYLTSFIMFDYFFNYIKKSEDVLFACPSRNILLILPITTKTSSNSGDLIVFGQFVFENYIQGEKKIRPDVYHWSAGKISTIMQYDDNDNMKEIVEENLARICT